MKKILILTADKTGSGHKSSSNAISKQLTDRGFEVRQIDVFTLMGRFGRFLEESYIPATTRTPWFFFILERTSQYFPDIIHTMMYHHVARNMEKQIRDYDPDLIITAAYGQFIPSAVLDYPRFGCINAHGSLLPKYRGGAPIQRAIINGENETGVSIMYMVKKMDAGDILMSRSIPIMIDDTNTTMFSKLSDLSLEMLQDLLPKLFSGDVETRKQNEEEATFAYNLEKEIEHIRFDEEVKTVYDHIRGLLDEPGAYFVCKGKKYKMEKVFFEKAEDSRPSTFIGLEKDYLRIDCIDGFIKVYQIRPEGKNSMDARSFHNGNGRNMKGETLE